MVGGAGAPAKKFREGVVRVLDLQLVPVTTVTAQGRQDEPLRPPLARKSTLVNRLLNLVEERLPLLGYKINEIRCAINISPQALPTHTKKCSSISHAPVSNYQGRRNILDVRTPQRPCRALLKVVATLLNPRHRP